MSTERLIINVHGGLVQDVYTDARLEVVIVDWDTEVQAAVLVDRCQTTC